MPADIDPEKIMQSIEEDVQRAAALKAKLKALKPNQHLSYSSTPGILIVRTGYGTEGTFAETDSTFAWAIKREINEILPLLVERALERMRQDIIHRREAAREAAARINAMLNTPIGGGENDATR